MPFEVLLTEQAERDLARLDVQVARRVRGKLLELAARSEMFLHVPLTGRFGGLFRLRSGAFRAIYHLDRSGRRIIVHQIGHRREVYGR